METLPPNPAPDPGSLRWDKLDPDQRASWDTLLRGLTLPPLSTGSNALSLRDAEPDPKFLFRCISSDPLLAAKVLTVANLSAGSAARSVLTLERASLQLGLTTLQGMVVSYYNEDTDSDKPALVLNRLQYVRRLAALGGVLAGRIAQAAGLADPALLHTAALLARLGLAVLAVADPDSDKDYWQAKSEVARLQYEAQRWSISSAALSGRLLAMWCLPEPLPALAAAGLDPLWWSDTLPPAQGRPLAVLCASQIVAAGHLGSPAARATDILERPAYSSFTASLRRLGLYEPIASAFLHPATQREMELLAG